MNDKVQSSTEAFDKALSEPSANEQYVLRLYVTGMTPQSSQAIQNLRAICDEYLDGQYLLEVIDIYQQPMLAKTEQIVAAPTLDKKWPPPMRRLIGNLSDRERVLAGLNIRRKLTNGIGDGPSLAHS